MARRTFLAHRVNEENYKWFTLGAACFGLFMAILDNLVVNIAMPTIAMDLDATTTQLQWLVSAYTLVFASLQITAGGLGDRLGRKRWFLIGLAIFTATSFLAAFSQSIEMLLLVRALQGLGAAFIMPLSLSLISVAFPPEERGRAVAIWGAISISGIALGPVVGGLLVEYASWEWVFLINVPIGVIAFLVTSAVVRESRDESGTVSTDVLGTVLITGAIAALTWGLIEAGNRGWDDQVILAAVAVAVVLGIAFVVVEARIERPMVPLNFFRSRPFTGANIDAFMLSFALAGVAFFMTLYQQNIHDYSAVKTGLALVPMVVVMMVMSPISGGAINRIGARRMITFGMTVTGIGVLLFLRSGVDATYWDILPAFLVMGFGMSFIWAPMTTAVLNSVPVDKSGIASAINGSIREIGTAFGIALLGTMANNRYKEAFENHPTTADLQAQGNSVIDQAISIVGQGASNAGHFLEQLPFADQVLALPNGAEVMSQIIAASSEAFIEGMDFAMIVGAVAMIASGILSYILITDEVFEKQPEPAAPDAALAPQPGD